MSLKTFVKVSNITNLSDARYCAGMMVDMLGFKIDPAAEDHITPKDYKEITDWVSGVQFVGEFEEAHPINISTALEQYEVDYIQINDLEVIEEIYTINVPIIFKLKVETQEELDHFESKLNYLSEMSQMVIVSSSNTRLFKAIDEKIKALDLEIRLLKGYGINAGDILEDFSGIELEATKEDKPGFKDYGEVMDVLEALEED
ncbi:MAG: phosphoribosylanthranilate isomerase [Bacteroidota bacterium]